MISFKNNVIENAIFECRVREIMQEDAQKDPAADSNVLRAKLLIERNWVILDAVITIFMRICHVSFIVDLHNSINCR